MKSTPHRFTARSALVALVLFGSLDSGCMLDAQGAPLDVESEQADVDGQSAALGETMINYAGDTITDADVAVFRWMLYWGTKATLGLDGGIKEWNENLLTITEDRKSVYDSDGKCYWNKAPRCYSWCGDWVTYHLTQAGSRHGLAINRVEQNGSWSAGNNLTFLRAWAGEPGYKDLTAMKRRFRDDPSKNKSWHAWSRSLGAPTDGYIMQPGDLLILEKSGGDHIEHFLEYVPFTTKIRTSAGAQSGGVAKELERDTTTAKIIGVIDVSLLAPKL